jgi:hypothetical protein
MRRRIVIYWSKNYFIVNNILEFFSNFLTSLNVFRTSTPNFVLH